MQRFLLIALFAALPLGVHAEGGGDIGWPAIQAWRLCDQAVALQRGRGAPVPANVVCMTTVHQPGYWTCVLGNMRGGSDIQAAQGACA